MSISDCIDKMKHYQNGILKFLEEDENAEENFQDMIDNFENEKIQENKQFLKLALHLIAHISSNFSHKLNFFSKIEKILNYFKNDIKNKYSNNEIFNIFKQSKRILLFLITEQIITLDKSIAAKFFTNKYISFKYPEYFAPEIKPILDNITLDYEKRQKISQLKNFIDNLPKDFEENRKRGENEEYICQLIRDDSIEDFIIHVNKNLISLNSTISVSIYETNKFLLKNKKKDDLKDNYSFLDRRNPKDDKEIKLIEYSAFWGSIQIFKYLYENNVKLIPSLWLYAIYGDHPEIFQILNDNKIKPISFDDCFREAIRCHFNSTASYIYDNYINNAGDDNEEEEEEEEKENNSFLRDYLKSYNFSFMIEGCFKSNNIYDLCKYDYAPFVAILLNNKCVDVNIISTKQKIKDTRRFKYQQYEETPLHRAVVDSNYDIVKLLLTAENIEVNFISKFKCGDDYFVESLNEEIQWKKIKKCTPLVSAVKLQNIEMVKILLSCNNINVNLEVVSLKSFGNFKFKNINYNHWRRYDNNGKYKRKSALIVAVNKGNTEIVRLLLENKKINPNCLSKVIDMCGTECSSDYYNEHEKTPLNIAVSHGDIEIVKLLLNHKAIDPNIFSEKYGCSQFIRYNDSEMSEDDTKDINDEKIHSKYKTALNIAIRKGSSEMVQLLLANSKVDINKINHSVCGIEKTALLYAIEKNKKNIVSLLLKRKDIDLNIKCRTRGGEKVTALLYAIDKNKNNIVSLLLKRKDIDLNIEYRTINGKKVTALLNAIDNENEDILKLLLDQKNLDLDYQKKKEALDHAYKTGNRTIISLLGDDENEEENEEEEEINE